MLQNKIWTQGGFSSVCMCRFDALVLWCECLHYFLVVSLHVLFQSWHTDRLCVCVCVYVCVCVCMCVRTRAHACMLACACMPYLYTSAWLYPQCRLHVLTFTLARFSVWLFITQVFTKQWANARSKNLRRPWPLFARTALKLSWLKRCSVPANCSIVCGDWSVSGMKSWSWSNRPWQRSVATPALHPSCTPWWLPSFCCSVMQKKRQRCQWLQEV